MPLKRGSWLRLLLPSCMDGYSPPHPRMTPPHYTCTHALYTYYARNRYGSIMRGWMDPSIHPSIHPPFNPSIHPSIPSIPCMMDPCIVAWHMGWKCVSLLWAFFPFTCLPRGKQVNGKRPITNSVNCGLQKLVCLAWMITEGICTYTHTYIHAYVHACMHAYLALIHYVRPQRLPGIVYLHIISFTLD